MLSFWRNRDPAGLLCSVVGWRVHSPARSRIEWSPLSATEPSILSIAIFCLTGSSVGGDAAAKVASRATPGTVKRRRKEHGVDDPVTQSKEDERVDVEDLPHETRETGAKHKKSKKAKGAHEPAPDWPAPDCETEPGIQKLKEAVQHAQLDSQSEDVQDESGSVDKEDAEEACQSASPTAMVQSGETQAETLKRTIFVGNLPQGTVSKDLKNLFKRCVRSILDTRWSVPCCFRPSAALA